MKPAPFAYHRPERREEVARLLAQLGDDAKVLAGGQSLVPRAEHASGPPWALVDLNGLRDEPREPAEDGGCASADPSGRS